MSEAVKNSKKNSTMVALPQIQSPVIKSLVYPHPKELEVEIKYFLK